MIKRYLSLIILCFNFCFLFAVSNNTINRYFFVSIYGFPPILSADIKNNLSVYSSVSNIATYEYENIYETSNNIYIDGETHNYGFLIEKLLCKNFSLGGKIEIVSHKKGNMDYLIQNFHKIINLNSAIRKSLKRGILDYRIKVNSNNYKVDKDKSGLSDLMIFVKHQILKDSLKNYSILYSLKLPTGDYKYFFGSGYTDFGLSFIGSKKNNNLTLDFLSGGLYIPKSKILPNNINHLIFFGNASLSYRLKRWFEPKLALYSNTPVYENTGLKILDGWPLQGSFGFSFYIFKTTQIDFALAEDLFVNSSPDITFFLSINKEF